MAVVFGGQPDPRLLFQPGQPVGTPPISNDPAFTQRLLQGLVRGLPLPLKMLMVDPNVPAQRPKETNLNHLLRQPVESVARAPAKFAQWGAPDQVQFARELFDTPEARQRRAAEQPQQPQTVRANGAAAASAFPNSYKDSAYDRYEAEASAKTGVPVEMLRAIRLAGERSNADQVSSAGARTPYQFIPETRAAFMRKYGVDAWKDPASAAMATALHLKENLAAAKGDPVTAMRMFHGGTDRNNWGPQNAGYAQRTGNFLEGLTGQQMAAGNAFDPTQYNRAIDLLGRSIPELNRPQIASMTLDGMPQVPDPIMAAPTDFTASDAVLARLDPASQAPTGSDKKRFQIQGIMSGVSQALMAIPEGAGLGKTLAMIGGGMLAGRSSGDQKFDNELDKFEEKVEQYNKLLLNNELGKAQTKRQEAVQQAQTLNQHNWQSYQAEFGTWSKFNNIQATPEGTSVTTMKDGKVTTTFTPNAAMNIFGIRKAQAGIMTQMGAEQNQGLLAEAQISDGVQAKLGMLSAAQAQAQGDPATAALGAQSGLAMLAGGFAESGVARDLFGEEWERVNAEVNKAVMERAAGGRITPEQSAELGNSYLRNLIMQRYQAAVQRGDKAFVQRFEQMSPLVQQGMMADMQRDARRRVTTKTGNTTVSTLFGE